MYCRSVRPSLSVCMRGGGDVGVSLLLLGIILARVVRVDLNGGIVLEVMVLLLLEPAVEMLGNPRGGRG